MQERCGSNFDKRAVGAHSVLVGDGEKSVPLLIISTLRKCSLAKIRFRVVESAREFVAAKGRKMAWNSAIVPVVQAKKLSRST